MSHPDFYMHVLGVVLLTALGAGFLNIRDKGLKQLTAKLFWLLFAVLLADAAFHLLPNALAGFIYHSYHHYTPLETLREK